MYNNIILSIIYFLCIQKVYSDYFNIVDGDIFNKTEVLNITNQYNFIFYCKNDVCVNVEDIELFPFTKFPNANGTLTDYIVPSCTYENAINSNCKVIQVTSEGEDYSNSCKNDTACLSNKCVNNFCVFNDAEPIVSCIPYYKPESLFKGKIYNINCGKAHKDKCNDDNDCSSKVCSNVCHHRDYSPSYGDDSGFVNFLLILMLLGVIIVIICNCYFYQKEKPNRGY